LCVCEHLAASPHRGDVRRVSPGTLSTMVSPKEVKYPQYRQFEAARIEASNSMMALLAGARLARHLVRLPEGSNRLWPEVFRKVQHRLPPPPHSPPDSIA